MDTHILTLIQQQMHAWHLPLSEQQIHSFDIYYHEIVKFSSVLGLTASSEQLGNRHFLDSLLPVPFLQTMDLQSVLDIGSGGGFPGLCLAVVFPDCQFTLCERNRKKAGFLLSSASLMSLKNITIYAENFEQVPGFYDLCTFRALMKVTPEAAQKVLKKAKRGLAYKGRMVEAEKELALLLQDGLSAHLQPLQHDAISEERTLLWFARDEVLI